MAVSVSRFLLFKRNSRIAQRVLGPAQPCLSWSLHLLAHLSCASPTAPTLTACCVPSSSPSLHSTGRPSTRPRWRRTWLSMCPRLRRFAHRMRTSCPTRALSRTRSASATAANCVAVWEAALCARRGRRLLGAASLTWARESTVAGASAWGYLSAWATSPPPLRRTEVLYEPTSAPGAMRRDSFESCSLAGRLLHCTQCLAVGLRRCTSVTRARALERILFTTEVRLVSTELDQRSSDARRVVLVPRET